MNDDKSRDNQPAPINRPVGMGRGPMAQTLAEKPKNFKATMVNLGKYLKPFWLSIAFVFIFAIASTVFAIVSPKILGNVTNQIVTDYIDMKVYDGVVSQLPPGTKIPPGTTGAMILKKMPATMTSKLTEQQLNSIDKLDFSKRPGIEYDKIIGSIWFLIALYGISSIFSYAQGWIMNDVSQAVTYRFRRDISAKIDRLPLRYFDTQTYGEILSRITNDVALVSQSLNQSLTQIVTAVATIIGILVMMLTISWQMTLVAIVTLPLSAILISTVVKRSQGYFKAQQDQLGDINGHIEEMYGGHNVVRVFGGEQQSIAKFNRINVELHDSAWKSQFLSGLMWPITGLIGNLGYVGVSVLGGYLAVKGTVQIGDIQAFIQYVSSFNQPIQQTAQIANVMQSTAAAAERVFEFLGETEEGKDVENPLTLTEVKGGVEFDNVVFGYEPGQTIIKGFSAKIEPGQRIAIVGPTGAGKTTMVNLLMRFYELNSGAIKIDGVDIGKMKRADVRKLFGMVLQDTWLFTGTIKQNIAYGKPEASETEIIEAAKAAHVDHFVHTLPHGYNMELNEEADNVSQGEKQLLTIARAMLAKTPMLILDEATSSVDTRTEVLIQKAMDRLMKGKTSFVIAHRLSTIRDADLILVMNEGNIVEQGTHDQLLTANGFYASLYNSQFAGAEI